jgi:WD40 repeat protein
MTFEGHSQYVTSVSFSPDGASIVSGSLDNTVKVWSVESGECVTTFEGHSDAVTSVSFSPDGASIVSGSWDKTVKVWSVESGECVFSGGHLDESWRAVFRNAADPPAECFDDAHTIGMSGEGTQDPRCYLSQHREGCLLVVPDGPRIHFLERRPVA